MATDLSAKEIKVTQENFLKMYNTYKLFSDKNKIEPDEVYFPDTASYIRLSRFREMLTRWIAYRKANNQRRPNFIWVVRPTATQTTTTAVHTVTTEEVKDPNIFVSPRYVKYLDQKTNYWCGPYMSVQLIYELFGKKLAQKYMSILEKTTTSGTSHAGIDYGVKEAVKEMGHLVTVKWETFLSQGVDSLARWKRLGQMIADPKIGIGIHCKYRNKWGHYMVPVYVNLKTKTVGFCDSLNPADIIYVSFAEAEQWIANTTNSQPSVFKMTLVS